jgi:hypothetical protein
MLRLLSPDYAWRNTGIARRLSRLLIYTHVVKWSADSDLPAKKAQDPAFGLVRILGGGMRWRSPTARNRYLPSGEKAICAPSWPPLPLVIWRHSTSKFSSFAISSLAFPSLAGVAVTFSLAREGQVSTVVAQFRIGEIDTLVGGVTWRDKDGRIAYLNVGWKVYLVFSFAPAAIFSPARPPETGVRTPLRRDRPRYPRFPGERVRDTSCEACEWPP